MKNSKHFFKYYTYGFLLSILLVGIVHLYGFFIDSFYAYNSFKISITAVFIVAIPLGLNFGVVNYLSNPLKFKNINLKHVVEWSVNYWIGILFSSVALIIILSCFYLFGLNSYYTTLDSLLIPFALILGFPLSILLNRMNYVNYRV